MVGRWLDGVQLMELSDELLGTKRGVSAGTWQMGAKRALGGPAIGQSLLEGVVAQRTPEGQAGIF